MGQVRFENFDFLVKVKGPPSQSIFSLSFFFFFFLQEIRIGSGFQVGPGQTRVVEDDVIHDVMRRGHVSVLGASSAWQVRWRVKLAPMMPEARGGAWLIVWA